MPQQSLTGLRETAEQITIKVTVPVGDTESGITITAFTTTHSGMCVGSGAITLYGIECDFIESAVVQALHEFMYKDGANMLTVLRNIGTAARAHRKSHQR